MKKYRVFGHTTVTVSTVLEVSDEEVEELDEAEIYERAAETFSGIGAFAGNGGCDKIIGVSGWHDSISADEDVEFDDFKLEEM